jgi:CDP-glucose 4,6-dehydratase
MESKSALENMEGLTGKNILVTGGTGFVGSHLVKALVARRATVFVPFRSLDPRSYFATERLSNKAVLVSCDLKDRDRIFDIVTKYRIDYIFHLAAQALVQTAYENPVETIESNVMGTTYILEAARRFSSVQGVIVASSDKSYGKSRKPYVETDPLCGDHPYEVSKSATDLIAHAYAKTYHVPVVVTRFGNIYGEGDLNFSRIIPGIMKAIIRKEKLVVRSDGTYIRDYVYVKDVVSGYLFLLHHIDTVKGEAFNLSSNTSYSVIDLIRQTERVLKRKIPYRIENSAKNEIPYQHLNMEKINKLGWKPTHSFKTTLPFILRWYKSILN